MREEITTFLQKPGENIYNVKVPRTIKETEHEECTSMEITVTLRKSTRKRKQMRKLHVIEHQRVTATFNSTKIL